MDLEKVWHIYVIGIYECVQFDADSNKNLFIWID